MNELQPTSLFERFHKSFCIFGTIALILGGLFAACFYKAGIGISYPVYVLICIVLLQKAAHTLRIRRVMPAEEFNRLTDTVTSGAAVTSPQTGTVADTESCDAVFLTQAAPLPECPAAPSVPQRSLAGLPYYIAAMLIAISTVFTTKTFLHFFSTVGILLLLECAFLEILFEGRSLLRSFSTRLSEVFLVPCAALANFPYAIIDSCTFLKKTRLFKNEKARQLMLGIIILIPLLAVVLALLASADMIFSRMKTNVLNSIFRSADPIWFVLLTVFIFTIVYSILCAGAWLSDRKDQMTSNHAERAKKPVKSLTAITVSGSLTIVYLIFCAIQILFLFGGEGSLPEGFTYAAYARQGFFQLLAVTVLNVLIVLLCLNASKESPVLKIVLTVMSACTYIMIASAAMRMLLYVSAYDLSFLRILVLWFLLVNTLLMTGAVLCIYRPAFPLFRYCIAVMSVCYIALAFSRPDYIIAKYNLIPERNNSEMDFNYLCELSSDAAPVLLPILSSFYNSGSNPLAFISKDNPFKLSLQRYADRIYYEALESDFRDFNFSEKRAVALIEELGLEPASYEE